MPGKGGWGNGRQYDWGGVPIITVMNQLACVLGEEIVMVGKRGRQYLLTLTLAVSFAVSLRTCVSIAAARGDVAVNARTARTSFIRLLMGCTSYRNPILTQLNASRKKVQLNIRSS